ncbi:MAG TPA: CBS domain-containing protein [Candidatus Binataceae bacterium]|nr:CBS domain-containing protein [Candidatus Binataceae bacterium]
MRTSDYMTPKPTTIGPRDRLESAKALMDAEKFHRLPVIEDGRLTGILSERDIRSHQGYLKTTLVDAAMSSDPVTVTPETSLEEVATLMLNRQIGGLPVIEDGKLVGIITVSDMLKAFLELRRKAAGGDPR